MELLSVTALAIIAIFFAFLAETIPVMVFGPLFDNISFLKPLKWLLMYIAFAAGLGMAIHYQIDLPAALIRAVGGVHPDEIYGYVISGIAIGGGATYILGLFSKYFPAPLELWKQGN